MVGAGWAIVITIVVLGVVGSAAWILYSRHRAQRLGVSSFSYTYTHSLSPNPILPFAPSPSHFLLHHRYWQKNPREANKSWNSQKQLPPPSFTSFLPFLNKSDHNHSSSYGAAPGGPRSGGGVQGWIGDQVRKFKDRSSNNNNRTASGAYEGAPRGGPGGGGRRGFGPLDPDEAWDARVGNEADNYGPGGYYEEQELGLHSQGPYTSTSSHVMHADENTSYGGGGRATGGGGLGAGSDSYAMNLAATPRMSPEDNRGRSRDAVGRNPFDDDAAEPSNISLRGVSPRPMEGATQGHQKVTSDTASERRSIFTEQV